MSVNRVNGSMINEGSLDSRDSKSLWNGATWESGGSRLEGSCLSSGIIRTVFVLADTQFAPTINKLMPMSFGCVEVC